MESVNLILLILAVITLIYAWISHRNNQKNLIISILYDVAKIADNSSSYPESLISAIRNEYFGNTNKKELSETIKKHFWEYLNPSFSGKTVKEIIHKDITLTNRIKNFCSFCVEKFRILIVGGGLNDIDSFALTYPVIPHYLIHEIDYNFYAKHISYSFPAFKLKTIPFILKTHDLKTKIFNLKRTVDVINYQIQKINSIEPYIPYLFNPKNLSKKEKTLRPHYIQIWSGFYYRVFMNLLELDKRVLDLYEELVKFDFILKQKLEGKKRLNFLLVNKSLLNKSQNR